MGVKSGTEDRRNGQRRQRRRTHQRPAIDHSVPSPCLAICRFDGEPFCIGCFRNADEIREWMIMSREQKLVVLDLLEERKQFASGKSE